MNEEKARGPVSLAVLATIAVIAALYLGRELLVPIGFAAVLSVALRPVVRGLKRVGVPAAIGGGLVVLALVGVMVVGVWLMTGPVKHWSAEMPQKLEAVQGRIERIRKPMERVTELAGKLKAGETSTRPTSGPTTREAVAAENQGEAEKKPGQPTGPEAPGVLSGALGTTRKFLSSFVEVILLVYLMLATDNLFFRKMIKVTPGVRDKEKAAQATDEVEDVVLRYLWVTLMINTGQGVVVGLCLWMLGVPAPWLWGLACVVLEFIPYLGAMVMIGLLAITAAATSDGGAWHVVAVPGSYLLITTIQNNIVSPYAYGNHLKLNPVAVLVGVMFWWFVWGIPGAFLAVPIVATTKIVADRVEGWKGLGEFLGE